MNCFTLMVEFVNSQDNMIVENNYELLLPKDIVKFEHGYGKVVFMDPFIQCDLMTFVNEDYEQVIDFQYADLIRKVKIMPNEKVLIVTKVNDEISEYNTFLIELNAPDDYISLDADDFEVVDDEVVILKKLKDYETYMSLYNVQEMRDITSDYTIIESFRYSEKYSEELARVTLKVGNYLNPFEVKFLMNKEGVIKSPIYDCYFDRYFQANELNDVIDLIGREVDQYFVPKLLKP